MSKERQMVEIPEPIFSPLEALESAEEKERREFIETGGDVAHFLVQFLRGNRASEITKDEISETKLFARTNEFERRALLFVCDGNMFPLPDETVQLKLRDAALMDFADGKHIRGDWSLQLRSIPAALRQRCAFDEKMFPQRQYRAPDIFGWLLGSQQ